MKIKPAKSINGTINLPGDKSISHRAAILAAMATGETRIENYATGADCASTLRCLETLGVEIRRENSTVFIKGVGKTGFQKPEKDLDCGNSGTTLRLLAGVLAGQRFDSVLTGDESLKKRPMRRIIEPLTQMGAPIEAENDCAPLKIYGRNSLRAISYEMPIPSAQIKSCVLLAGLNAMGKTVVVEKSENGYGFANTRDHTERMLAWLGAKVEIEPDAEKFTKTISIEGGAQFAARNIEIPGDVSSAAFFLVAAACLPGSDLTIKNVGLNFTRTNLLNILQEFTPSIEIENEREVCGEPIGDVRVRGAANVPNDFGFTLNPHQVPAMIDELPVLAILGTRLWTSLEVRGARELRVKESDRIKAIVENLKKMNARVEEFANGFRIEKSDLKGTKVNSFGDHRIAMAFSVAALFATGETEIFDAECADVSFPEFFETLAQIRK